MPVPQAPGKRDQVRQTPDARSRIVLSGMIG